MLQGNLPQSLWTEVVNVTTYIRNRCATKTLNDKTSFEAWSKRKPYVGFFRIIGSKAIVLNKAQGRGKFQSKGNKYMLVGYSEEPKAYRLWRPETRTVIKARYVKFFENQDSINVSTKDPLSMPDDTKAITVDNSSNTPLEQSDYQSEEYEQRREENGDSDLEESIKIRLQDTTNEEDALSWKRTSKIIDKSAR